MHVLAPRPECTTNPECPDHLACIQEKCLDPCTTLACGTNAECSVRRHRPTCTCRGGFIGDPFKICRERKISILSSFTPPDSSSIPIAGCRSDDECPLTEACYDRECSDPCLYQECGSNAICTARLHRAFCHCREGTKGNPYESCRPYECLIDSDCHDTLKCENEKCVDPCACAKFADCTPRNHRGVCTCFPDYTGNPYGIACEPSKITCSRDDNLVYFTFFSTVPEPVVEEPGCYTDGDCPSKQACFDGECLNPCLHVQPCVQNAECAVKNELPLRVMVCTCKPGYTGKGDERCELISKLSICSMFGVCLIFLP